MSQSQSQNESVRYRVRHETAYDYSGEVVHAHHLLHLQPRDMSHQRCSAYALHLDPQPTTSVASTDGFGNPVQRLEFDRPHRRLAVVADMTIEVHQRQHLKLQHKEPWERVRNRLAYVARPPEEEQLEAGRYRAESPHVRIKQMFTEYGVDCFTTGRPIVEATQALMMKLHRDMTYAPGATDIATPLTQILAKRRGVCQDYAHLMIASLRSRGLAARYVSGYLRTIPRDGTERLLGADASHAWVAVWCPPSGWIEFDPTNGVRAGLDHIALAWGRDFGDVSPLRGVIVGGGRHTLSVRVAVRPEDG
jgi:transglutaminase-like putative cysteine protease